MNKIQKNFSKMSQKMIQKSFKNDCKSKGENSWYCFVITYMELLEDKFILYKLSF